jgi:hypothetical protein
MTMTETQCRSSLNIVDYRLRFSRPLSPGEASHLRGFFGRAFADAMLLHHHHVDGTLHYAYPRVQFKVLDRTAHLIGLAEGADLVTRLWSEVDQAKIGEETLPVLEGGLIRHRETFGETSGNVTYGFRTPWIGLNQANHREYQAITELGEQRALLERILVGNCLSLSNAFGYRVAARLTADARGLRPWPTRLKSVPMLAFLGTFRINFQLPNHIGIGKSVSRGFGTVERIRNELGRGELC